MLYISVSALNRIIKLKEDKRFFSVLAKYGTKRNLVEEIKSEFANRKPEKGKSYYYYIGPNDDKTRPFCKMMLQIDKVFSEDEIEYMTEELGYSVLKYEGSYNCRHSWIKFTGKIISTPRPTAREIRKLINSGIQA